MKTSSRVSRGKLTTAAMLVAMLTGASAVSAQSDSRFLYSFGVDGKSKVPVWLVINNIYGAWTNVGGPHSCLNWAQPESSVNWGQAFQQSRVCQQNQSRDVTPILLNPVLGTTKEGEVYAVGRTLNVTQYQPAVGKLDYITTERADEWGAWNNVGGHYGCDTWSPSPDVVKLEENFTQNRDCDQNQSRTRQVHHVWASGKETPKRIDTDAQTITETESRVIEGTMDYIDGQSIKLWSAWSNVDAPHSCSVWSPSPSTVNLDQAYTQNRMCSQDQTSSRDIYDVWKSGVETFLRTENRAQEIDAPQSRAATGTKDYITSTETRSWSAWSNSGNTYDCSGWTPVASSVNLDAGFTQTQSCSQNQASSRDIYNVWKSGAKTLLRTENRSQKIIVEQSQSATGTKDYITGTTDGPWSAWSNSGGAYSCSGWTPSPSTVNLDATFTQTQSCSQNQTASRTIYNVWKSGKKTHLRTESKSQTVSVGQSQSATGTKDYITGTTPGNWSAWSNSGGAYSCSGWTPSPSTVNLDATFTQTQSCSQNQTASRTIYNVWKSGKKTHLRTESKSQTVSVGQSQSATGTKDYITGTTPGNWSAWSNSGGAYSCSGWTPSPSTVNLDATFTQTQSCSQNQTASRTIYNVWKSGKKTHLRTESKSQTVSVGQSQSATGTKDYITGTRTGNWSAWSNTGGVYGCGGWSPSTSSVKGGVWFTQTRSCSQGQSVSRTVYNVWKSGTETYLRTDSDSRTVGATQSQPARGDQDHVIGTRVGSWSPWSNSGGLYGCGGWSPSEGSVKGGVWFTQTRSCSQGQSSSRPIYNVWWSGAETYSRTDYRQQIIGATQSQPARGEQDHITGSRAGSWSSPTNSGGLYGCSGWSPSTSSVQSGVSFTQTQSCTQGQTSSRTIYNVWWSGTETYARTETNQSTISVPQSRPATGTDGGVSQQNVGATYPVGGLYSCTSYSPAESTVNWGTNYTMSRTCKQNWNQKTTTTVRYSDGSTSSSSSYSPSTTNVTDTKPGVGKKDYYLRTDKRNGRWGSYSYVWGPWSPDPSTVDQGVYFQQTRDWTGTRPRYEDHYRVYASGKETATLGVHVYNGVATGYNTRNVQGTKAPSFTWSKVASDECLPIRANASSSAPSGSCSSSGATQLHRKGGSCFSGFSSNNSYYDIYQCN